MTEWKRSNNNNNSNNSYKKEGFGSRGKSKSKDDMHTRIILEKLRNISAKKKHENFANINPLRNVYEKEEGGSRGGSRAKKVREGMDEGIFKNQSNLRLDDDDYDGHDNVDDDEEEAVINDMFKKLMGNISSGLKELFDRIELMFYYVAIFIYLVFSGGDMSRLNWFETQEQEVGAGVNSMDIPKPDVGGVGGVKQDEGFDIGGIKKGEGDFDEEELEKKKKTGEKINKAKDSIPDKTPGVSASASFATVNEKDWRSRFNEKEVEDIELIYSYIAWGECISLAILFTYGLYFYMFYTETVEHILNGNVKSARPSFCSWRWLVPFFSFSYKDFEDFYRKSVDQEVDEDASQVTIGTSLVSWFFAGLYIIFQDSVYAIAVINEILMYWIPDYTKSLQDKLGFSNSFIFFVLALGVSLFLYSFGGQIKALILEGMFGFDFKNIGLLGAIILFLTVVPQISKYASSIWNINQMNVVPNEPIQVEGTLVGGSIFGKKEEKKEETEEDKEERIKNKIILPSLKYTNGTSIIDTYGYLLVNTIEKHMFPYPASPTFSLIGKHIYNFFRFIFGLLISQILLPIYIVIYLIVFFLINPIMTLGGHFMQIIKNINTHKELTKDEYYNIFYVNDEGKNKTIDAAEVARVIDKDYGEGWMWYLNVFGEFINYALKTVFGPVFTLMFLVLLTYFRSDLAENGNNSKLQNTLGPALLGMIGLTAFIYLYQLYKSVKEEGGRIIRFLRDFLGIRVATNDASKASKASKTSNSDEDMKGGDTNDAKQDATMEDLIRAFKEAKSNVNKYSPDRWDNVLKQFKESFNSKSEYNDVKFEPKVNAEGQDNTEKSIQNMTIDHFRQALHRYFTAKYHDYIPLRSMYKSAGKDHPINQTFASRSCAPHTQMNEEK